MNQNEKIGKYLGIHVRLRRQELDLSQDEVAERAGIDETTIGKIERSERTPLAPTLFKISTAMNISLDRLKADVKKRGIWNRR